MKPIQVGILVAVAAVAGGLVVKWQTSKPAPQTTTVAATPAATPSASTDPAAAAPPAADNPASQAKPVEALPSPFGEEKTQKKAIVAKKSRPAWRQQPSTVAQNHTPQSSPAVAAAPAPVAPPAQSAGFGNAETSSRESATFGPPIPVIPPPPPPPQKVTLTAGTLIPARTVEALSSERNHPGDTFTATLDQPLVVDGLVIAERGARLEGKIVQSQQAGRVKGLADLSVELTQITTSDGQKVALETETFEKHGPSSTGEDAAKVGAAAGVGAIIGAIAGGGKGAGIGAVIGGAAGGGGVMATRGKPAVIPPETRINFRLRDNVTIIERQSARR